MRNFNSLNTIVWLVVGVFMLVVSFAYTKAAGEEAVTSETVTVELEAVNNSGVSGKATLTPVDNNTKVVINLTGAPEGIAQPAHIHQGTCENLGGPKYPLEAVKNGESETTVDVKLNDITTGDFATHTHAGNGPWLQYTAILAQYHYWYGDPARGDELLHMIDKHTYDSHEIPEHLSTYKRFESFIEREWQTGIDFDKEFDKEILLDNVTFDNILEEANNMRRAYTETEKCILQNNEHSEGGCTYFCFPLMWSHVEYARALMIREKDWWGILSEKDVWSITK